MLYQGATATPIYGLRKLKDENFRSTESFLTEYRRKLRHAPARLYTAYGRSIAAKRDETMRAYAEALLREVRTEDT